MPIKFCPIASGSSGNCMYVGAGDARFLIDAGVSGTRITEGLDRIGVSPWEISAVLITHDHSDHIKGAGVFSRKYDKPVYATKGTWDIMGDAIGEVRGYNVKYIEKKTFTIAGAEITSFETSHDAKQPVCFSVSANGTRATVATDMGKPSETLLKLLSISDIVLIEANHDEDMLKKGSYPFVLKKRILSDVGHLSNEAAGETLSKAVSDRLKYVYLGHLSEENNTPRMAFDTVLRALRRNKKITGNFAMGCAKRHEVSVAAEV